VGGRGVFGKLGGCAAPSFGRGILFFNFQNRGIWFFPPKIIGCSSVKPISNFTVSPEVSSSFLSYGQKLLH
jgi:hypothetical protein